MQVAAMVSLAKSPDDTDDAVPVSIPSADTPKGPVYPWGTSISLRDDELEKLKIDPSSLPVGTTVHLFALGKVTAVRSSATENDSDNCVEIQITDLALESEDEENDDMDAEEERRAARRKRFYNGPRASDD